MLEIKFENRAVAFIDVLGFKSVVERANVNNENMKILKKLVCALLKAIPYLDSTVDKSVHEELFPKYIVISDCVILSAPLTSDIMKDYCGLSVLVMRVIQLTHILLDKGYLIRGGISIGDVWHTDSNIVGPAYQEAYFIETKTVVPRVELSKEAEDYWRSKEINNQNTMCLNYEDKFMVNGLHDYYANNKNCDISCIFESYKNVVNKNINANINENAKSKWRWFGEFLESEMERNKLWLSTPNLTKVGI